MQVDDRVDEQALCLECGLCCDGSLFAWVKLRPAELQPANAAGLRVYGAHPADRGFALPCSAFVGHCVIYHSGFYPKGCLAFRCELLKRVSNGEVSVAEARESIRTIKRLVAELRSAFGNNLSEGDLEVTTSLRDALAVLGEKNEGKDGALEQLASEYVRRVKEELGVSGISEQLEQERY